MKNASDILQKIQDIEMSYYENGNVHQFTIDMIERCLEDVQEIIEGENDFPAEIILSCLSYKLNCALEIYDTNLSDFYVLQHLYNVINEKD